MHFFFLDDTKIFRIITKDTDTAHLQEDPEKCKHLHTGNSNDNIVNGTVG